MDDTALHPYRKRKFFYELTELLGERPPVLSSTANAAYATTATTAAASRVNVTANTSGDGGGGRSQDASPDSSSASIEEDSCAFVEFDGAGVEGSVRLALASQNSGFESTQDSASLVPAAASAGDERVDVLFSAALYRSQSTSRRRLSDDGDNGESKSDAVAAAASATVAGSRGLEPPDTELVSSDVARRKLLLAAPLELADYFDSDRMCETTPCWLYEERLRCDVHADAVACPMLLFCLQVMDEFIAFNAHQQQEPWRVAACRLAQSVFVARWDAHLLNVGGSQEIELQDFVQRKVALAGVSYEVWRIVAAYWDRYKQNYLHHQELYFTDVRLTDHTAAPQSSGWDLLRNLTHIYGMQLTQAARLAGDLGTSAAVDYLSTKLLFDLVASSSRTSPLRFGVAYLRNQVQSSVKKPRLAPSRAPSHTSTRQHHLPPPVRRHVVSQPEWKIAFNAIVIHLQKWNPRVHVFPCGAFSRGAAYGSTIDVLVAAPKAPGRTRTRRASALCYEEVIGALTSAKIVQKSEEYRVAPTRSLFAVPFKKVSLILDLKVFEQPKSWFALVYFTGPQSFVGEFFSALLHMSLHELSEPSFDAIYGKATEVLGHDKLASVESEKDVFALADREYILPSFRR